MDDMAVEMVACADKYFLPKLKEQAADVIIKHVPAVEDQLRLVNAFLLCLSHYNSVFPNRGSVCTLQGFHNVYFSIVQLNILFIWYAYKPPVR